MPATTPLSPTERATLIEALELYDQAGRTDLDERIAALNSGDADDVDPRLARLRKHLAAYDETDYDVDNIVPLAANDGLESQAVRSRDFIVDRIRVVLGLAPLYGSAADDPNSLTAFSISFGGGSRITEDGR